MSRIVTILAAALCVITLSACTSVHTSDAGSINHYPQTVGPTDHYRPLYKVEPTKKVSGAAEVNVLFGIFAWGDTSNFADNAYFSQSLFSIIFPSAREISGKAAFYNACKAAACDAVVAARYEIEETDYFVFKILKTKVSGFPATLIGVETVKPMPYYIDGSGNVVVMKEFVTPHLLFDASKGKCWLF